jgi:predicted lipoprotein with Yx(FWY)xxD motif
VKVSPITSRTGTLVLAAVAGLAIAACGSGSSPSTSSAASKPKPAATLVETRTATVDGKSETVLTNSRGLVLYYFTPDRGGKVTCTGSCASLWPPLMLPSGQSKPTGPSSISAKLGTVANPSGGTQVTYNGWPLYTYAKDTDPGDVYGQNVGGKWFVVTPNTPPAS